jgi:hypothetical protein
MSKKWIITSNRDKKEERIKKLREGKRENRNEV